MSDAPRSRVDLWAAVIDGTNVEVSYLPFSDDRNIVVAFTAGDTNWAIETTRCDPHRGHVTFAPENEGALIDYLLEHGAWQLDADDDLFGARPASG